MSLTELSTMKKTGAQGMVLKGIPSTRNPAQVRQDGVGVNAQTPDLAGFGLNPDSSTWPEFRTGFFF